MSVEEQISNEVNKLTKTLQKTAEFLGRQTLVSLRRIVNKCLAYSRGYSGVTAVYRLVGCLLEQPEPMGEAAYAYIKASLGSTPIVEGSNVTYGELLDKVWQEMQRRIKRTSSTSWW